MPKAEGPKLIKTIVPFFSPKLLIKIYTVEFIIGVFMTRGMSTISINSRSIIQRIQGLLSDFNSMVVQHMHIESNFTDRLSITLCLHISKGCSCLRRAPVGLNPWLFHDR